MKRALASIVLGCAVAAGGCTGSADERLAAAVAAYETAETALDIAIQASEDLGAKIDATVADLAAARGADDLGRANDLEFKLLYLQDERTKLTDRVVELEQRVAEGKARVAAIPADDAHAATFDIIAESAETGGQIGTSMGFLPASLIGGGIAALFRGLASARRRQIASRGEA
ncbi:MAG: hypothetical protein RIB60_06025 [Phycisphaerales bacterium]